MHVILLSVLRSIAGSPSCSRVLRRRTTTSFHKGYFVCVLSRFVPCPHVTRVGRENKKHIGPQFTNCAPTAELSTSFVEESPNSTHNPSNSQHKNNSSPSRTPPHHCECHCDITQNRQGSLGCCHNWVRVRHCVPTTALCSPQMDIVRLLPICRSTGMGME